MTTGWTNSVKPQQFCELYQAIFLVSLWLHHEIWQVFLFVSSPTYATYTTCRHASCGFINIEIWARGYEISRADIAGFLLCLMVLFHLSVDVTLWPSVSCVKDFLKCQCPLWACDCRWGFFMASWGQEWLSGRISFAGASVLAKLYF